MSDALAIKYRPKEFSELTEQSSIVTILKNQIKTDTIKHGYLFCGGAGTGKTTSARIFADMINSGNGAPIELDAASNNSVEDVRRITEQAQTKSLDGKYKIFIMDEVHSLSSQAWQALLKTLEEPPALSIFIMCTTNPEKIPKTILSRSQRYNFRRISHQGIIDRLVYIIEQENICIQSEGIQGINYNPEALDYIAKVADGGMRDAITLMDKCLSYSPDLSISNVIKALGVADYEVMFKLNNSLIAKKNEDIITVITDVYNSGIDLKQFIKDYFEFILDLNVYGITGDISQTKLPSNWKGILSNLDSADWEVIKDELKLLADLQSAVKWEHNPKSFIIAKLILFVGV